MQRASDAKTPEESRQPICNARKLTTLEQEEKGEKGRVKVTEAVE